MLDLEIIFCLIVQFFVKTFQKFFVTLKTFSYAPPFKKMQLVQKNYETIDFILNKTDLDQYQDCTTKSKWKNGIIAMRSLQSMCY